MQLLVRLFERHSKINSSHIPIWIELFLCALHIILIITLFLSVVLHLYLLLFYEINELDEEKEQWMQYGERLGHFFMCTMGPKCYKLMRSLITPSEPNDRTYKELVDALQEHHDPQPSETAQRFWLNSRNHTVLKRQPEPPHFLSCLVTDNLVSVYNSRT